MDASTRIGAVWVCLSVLPGIYLLQRERKRECSLQDHLAKTERPGNHCTVLKEARC